MTKVIRIYKIMRDFTRQMRKKNISAYASSISFFTFVSMIPLVMLVVAILPFTPLTEDGLLMIIKEFTPSVFETLIVQTINDVYDRNTGIITISILVTIWSAGKAMLAVIRGLNAINEVEEDRNYILLRLVASIYTVIFLLAMMILMVLLLFGQGVTNRVVSLFPGLMQIIRWFMRLRFLALWLFLTICFAIIYTYVPNKKLRLKRQLPGALFSAVVWSITSWGFSVYIDLFLGYNAYGSFSTIILLLLYLYVMMYIMMVGAHINRYFGPVYRFLFERIGLSKRRNK